MEETARFATVTVLRTNGYTGLVELDYSTSDLTAIAGDDYRGITGKLVFGDGETVKSLDIPVLDDKLEEGAEATLLSETASLNSSASGMHCGGVELVVGAGANLRYVNLQDWATGVWHFAAQILWSSVLVPKQKRQTTCCW